MTKYKSRYPGRIYKQYNKHPDGTRVDKNTWTVRYKGKDYATGETDPKKAEAFLLQVIAKAALEKPRRETRPWARNRHPADAPKEPGALMSQILDGFVTKSKRKGLKGHRNNLLYADHLRKFFGKTPATSLTSALFEKYQDTRLAAGVQNGTVNREMGALKRALNIAMKETDPPLIQRFPKITMLPEAAPRKGFLPNPDYIRLKAALPPYLVLLLVTGYHVGSRLGELVQLELSEIEMDAAQPQFRLYGDATKSGEGRVIPIYGEMVAAFQEQIAMTQRDYPDCKWVFHNKGEQILTFYKAWNAATKLAKLDGLLFHDLRRSAVRNLTRAGIKRKAAMLITGHKTESVFERYNIIDEGDMADVAAKMNAYFEKLNAPISPLIS